jgi:hypothetical protein
VTVTRGVLKQIVSPDDEHYVLETCRELNIKINTQLLFQQNALVLLKAQDITICTFLSLYS